MNYADLGKSMFLLGTYEDYDIDDIIGVLRTADDLYHNDQESFIADNEYDALRAYAEQLDPENLYFLGVGSDIRGGKVKLPYELGSLDQVQIGEIQDWVRQWTLEMADTVITDKLDGTSALLIYAPDGKFQIAYSRGNGTEGADISRHVSKFKSVPKQIDKQAAIRGEVILTKHDFEYLQDKVMSRSGKPYKNARNMVAGLMNASSNDPIVYEYLHLVAYDVKNDDSDKSDQLAWLDAQGFHTPFYELVKGYELKDEALANYLNTRREKTSYEIDGIVIDVNDSRARAMMNPSKDTLNPAYAIKYKVADASNQAVAKVVEVQWNASKHGYMKPRVKIEPVELVGVTVQHATGFNAKFIWDNKIGPGAEIQITRSGDVIPFIQKTITPANVPQMPDVKWEWNETEVDAVMIEQTEEVIIQQVIDFFAGVDAPFLREGTVRTTFEKNNFFGFTDAVIMMMDFTESQWVNIIGENGKKVYDGLRNRFKDIPLYVLMGSLPFFGRGIGKRKMKKIEQAYGTERLQEFDVTSSDIRKLDGFKDKTVLKIMDGIGDYYDFHKQLPPYVSVQTMDLSGGGKMEGHKVVFTGFRDKELEQQVEDEGGQMQTTISSKTTILVSKTPTSNSGKMKKARDIGVQVMGIDDFKLMME